MPGNKLKINQKQNTRSDVTINNLPPEIIMHIFTFLDFKSLIQANKTCTKFHAICSANKFFKRKSKKKIEYTQLLIRNRFQFLEETIHTSDVYTLNLYIKHTKGDLYLNIKQKSKIYNVEMYPIQLAIHVCISSNDNPHKKREALEIIKILIEAGADLNVKNGDNLTPLEMAEKYQDEKIIELLKKNLEETEVSQETKSSRKTRRCIIS